MARLLTKRSQGEDDRVLSRVPLRSGYLTVETTVFDNQVRAGFKELRVRQIDFRGHPLQFDGKVGETWWALRLCRKRR